MLVCRGSPRPKSSSCPKGRDEHGPARDEWSSAVLTQEPAGRAMISLDPRGEPGSRSPGTGHEPIPITALGTRHVPQLTRHRAEGTGPCRASGSHSACADDAAMDRARMSTDLIRRARFEALAADVFEPLQLFLTRRPSASDAADVFSSSLMVIWRRLDDVPTHDPLPWCYAVARRCLANHQRGSERRLRLADRVSAQPPEDSSGADPQQIVDRSEPRLVSALDALSESESEIVRLWAWEQLEPREISEVLGLTPNAVSVTLSRAKRKLRDELDDRQDPASAGH